MLQNKHNASGDDDLIDNSKGLPELPIISTPDFNQLITI